MVIYFISKYILTLLKRIDEENKISEQNLIKLDDNDDPEIAPGEFIFIIDRSGSMREDKMEHALNALKLLIKSIPINSKFNVISFGTKFEALYPISKIYSNDIASDALNQINTFKSDMGGTELLSLFQYILDQPQSYKYPRNLFLITDGDVKDHEPVINIVAKFSKNTRVYTFGIGKYASVPLISEIARVGKGSATFLKDNDPDFNSLVIKALTKAAKAAYTNLNINWMENQEAVKFPSPDPRTILYIYEDEPINFYAILSKDLLTIGTIEISYFNTLKRENQLVQLTLNPDQIQNSNNTQVYQLAAAKHLEFLDTKRNLKVENLNIKTSIKYSVLHSTTTFFANIKQKSMISDEVKLVLFNVRIDLFRMWIYSYLIHE